jgi:hypothetical protein
VERRPLNIIEHSDLSQAEAVLRLCHPSEPLDPALADLGRLVPQMDLQRISDGCPIMGIEMAKLSASS